MPKTTLNLNFKFLASIAVLLILSACKRQNEIIPGLPVGDYEATFVGTYVRKYPNITDTIWHHTRWFNFSVFESNATKIRMNVSNHRYYFGEKSLALNNNKVTSVLQVSEGRGSSASHWTFREIDLVGDLTKFPDGHAEISGTYESFIIILTDTTSIDTVQVSGVFKVVPAPF